MFLAKALLSGGSGGGRGGDLVRGLGGLLSGGGQGGNVGGLLGGLVNLLSEAAAQYTPEPPPPRGHFTNVEAYESEEVKQFRCLFAQLAGSDMEVSASELMHILNKVLSRHQDLKTDGFSLDTCRSMVAIMDSDTTGKLGFEEFKYLWKNIKKWQCVFKQFDTERAGAVGDEHGALDFNSFISCLVRLDGMFRAFKALDHDGHGQVDMTLQDWLQLTMYS
ncbi:PREDICTED: LOW QUALITY PROTEIN: calpain small subunit 1-like [Tinamus guttatus]|uniref:LOW QUALITY PROTEIN: calpain small subunit 1-like n=1 Tax=Tinamus guttatus TaxID=94827 RepID=UPI00052EB1B3|nr:PREDICTED: LOW QUALITY PROTEIN: calpain small subunit 1-like [Tinamus guttatus]